MMGKNKYYLYNFITDNCTTRVKDGLFNKFEAADLTVLQKEAKSFIVDKIPESGLLSSAKKEDLLLAITDVLISHSNLVFQINKKFEKESQNIEKPN